MGGRACSARVTVLRVIHAQIEQSKAHFGLQGGGCSFCQFSRDGGARYAGNSSNGSGLSPTKIVGIGTWLNCSPGAGTPPMLATFPFKSACIISCISSFAAYTVTPFSATGTSNSFQNLAGLLELSRNNLGVAPERLIASAIANVNCIASGSAKPAKYISLKWPRSSSAIASTCALVKSLGFNRSSIATLAVSLFSARSVASAARSVASAARSFAFAAVSLAATASWCPANPARSPKVTDRPPNRAPSTTSNITFSVSHDI